MKPLFIFLLCLAVQQLPPFLSAARAQAPGERAVPAAEADLGSTILSLERQRAAALVRRDSAALRALMDRQYYHVEARGRVRSKTELLTALERDQLRFQVYEIESTEVRVLDGGAAALVTGVFRSVQANAPTRIFRARFARLWVRQQDGWKNTFHQSTEIKPAQDACRTH